MPSKIKCCVCGSKESSVHSFPSAKYQDIYEKWIDVLSSHGIPIISSSPNEVRQKHRICEKHFKEDDFFIAHRSNKTKKKLLKHNSVPFLNDIEDPVAVVVRNQPVPVNDQVSNKVEVSKLVRVSNKVKPQESQTIDNADATDSDLMETESVENICIPVDCTDFLPKPTRARLQDSYRLYRRCMRQQKTIEKQREIIRDLKKRLKLSEKEPQSGNKLNDEFVLHQKQNIRKPRGRRYTQNMKLLGAQMLKQGTIAEYEKWRKLFVMPSRRTLKRISKDLPAQMSSNENLWDSLQMVMNEPSKEGCSSNEMPIQPELVVPASN